MTDYDRFVFKLAVERGFYGTTFATASESRHRYYALGYRLGASLR